MFRMSFISSAILRGAREYSKRSPAIRSRNSKPQPPPPEPIVRSANAIPFITCKRSEFDMYIGDPVPENAEFNQIPLASAGWQHYKSKNDFFTIHPYIDPDIEAAEKECALSFDRFNLDPRLLKNLRTQLNIEHTTYIQNQAIPHIQTGKHTLIAAETGCGKTVSYLLPILQSILERKQATTSSERKLNTPLALVLTPGRELAQQIGSVAEQLCNNLDLSVKVLIGGSTKKKMMDPTLEDVDLLVGTMGVVSKLVTTGIYRMQHVHHVVLDEADTLLDDSFNEKLLYFMQKFPFYKTEFKADDSEVRTQLVLASATMPTNIEERLMEVIDVSTVNEVVSPSLHRILPHIRQHFIRIRKSERPLELLTLVKKELQKRHPIMIFSNKTATSDFISIFLNEHNIKSISMHGNLLNVIRTDQFKKFQSGNVNVLSTTDVGSRGLDTTRVHHVINFDFPLYTADYIHRCGRIGRQGSMDNCKVTNFISSLSELDLVRKIEHAVRTQDILPNVNGNITNIILKKIEKEEDKQARREIDLLQK